VDKQNLLEQLGVSQAPVQEQIVKINETGTHVAYLNEDSQMVVKTILNG